MKRWLLFLMIIMLVLSTFAGCKAPDLRADQGASAGDQLLEGEDVTFDESQTGSGETAGEDDKLVTLPEDKPDVPPQEETSPEEEVPAEIPEKEPEVEIVTDPGNHLKIVDYNVRCADDGPNKLIEERAARFEILMDQLDPDIMGLQEVTPRWLDYLTQNFTDEYEYVHRWRAASSQEGTPIFWKKDKFKKLDSGYFWLSDTPSKESKADNWGAECYRICMWVKLRVKATGKDFLFFNTHFDFKNSTCHVNSAKVVITEAVKQKAFGKYAIFCTGDYNMGPNGEGYKAMYEKFADINADLNNDKSPTTNGYNEGSGGGIIDFVFYSPRLVVPKEYRVLNEEINGGYISDHRGLYVEAALI